MWMEGESTSNVAMCRCNRKYAASLQGRRQLFLELAHLDEIDIIELNLAQIILQGDGEVNASQHIDYVHLRRC